MFIHKSFIPQEKELFVKEMKEKKSLKKKTLSAEEMSIFYRNFLNENRQSHLEYNRCLNFKDVSKYFFSSGFILYFSITFLLLLKSSKDF